MTALKLLTAHTTSKLTINVFGNDTSIDVLKTLLTHSPEVKHINVYETVVSQPRVDAIGQRVDTVREQELQAIRSMLE